MSYGENSYSEKSGNHYIYRMPSFLDTNFIACQVYRISKYLHVKFTVQQFFLDAKFITNIVNRMPILPLVKFTACKFYHLSSLPHARFTTCQVYRMPGLPLVKFIACQVSHISYKSAMHNTSHRVFSIPRHQERQLFFMILFRNSSLNWYIWLNAKIQTNLTIAHADPIAFSRSTRDIFLLQKELKNIWNFFSWIFQALIIKLYYAFIC